MGNLLSKPSTEYKAHHVFGQYNADGGLRLKRDRHIERNITIQTTAYYIEILADYKIAQERYKVSQCKYCTYDIKISTQSALLALIFGSFQ